MRVPKIISFCSQKGGVAKTTTAHNLGAALSKLGKEVVYVDLDPQASLTRSLGLSPDELSKEGKTTLELLKGTKNVSDIAIQVGSNWLLPSSRTLAQIELDSYSQIEDDTLKKALSEIEDTDFIFIDCPPQLGTLFINAAVSSDQILVPSLAEYLAVSGLEQIVESIEKVRDLGFNENLTLNGVLVTNFQKKKSQLDFKAELKKKFKTKLYQTSIRHSAEIPKSQSLNKSIFEHRPKSIGAVDYMEVAKEFLQKVKK